MNPTLDIAPQPIGPSAPTGTRRRLLRTGLAATAALGAAASLRNSPRAAAQSDATPVPAAGTRFVAVRSYVLADGVTFAEVAAIADEGFLPILAAAPGFVAHYISDIGAGRLLAVSIWESSAAADDSAVLAADFVAANLADKFQGPPEQSLGSDTVYREACAPSPAATPAA